MTGAGRVKTLHPKVHGGILGKRKDSRHQDALQAHSISFIDVVIVNLYPFRQTVTASQQPSFPDAIEQIDIGGAVLPQLQRLYWWQQFLKRP